VGDHVDRGGDVADIVLTADHFEAALETVGSGGPEQDDVDGQGLDEAVGRPRPLTAAFRPTGRTRFLCRPAPT